MGGLTAREPENEMAEQIEPGNYQGVCYSYIDLGTHHVDFNYEGKHIVGDYHKVMITWEIPSERIEITKDGEVLNLPRVISKEYNLTLGKKANLRKDLESWRGKDFTEKELEGWKLDGILGANAMINIIHNEKGYANIAVIAPLIKGMPKKDVENPMVGFSIKNDGFENIPESIPQWIQDKIQKSLEWENYSGDTPKTNEPGPNTEDGDPGFGGDDDIPF